MDPEIDLIGADKPVPPATVAFVGSIKWRADRRFSRRDMAELRSRTERAAGVGPSTRIVAVSRSGFDVARDELAFALGPQDVIEAWAKAPPGRSGCAGA